MKMKDFKGILLVMLLLFSKSVYTQSAIQNYVDEWIEHPFFKNSNIGFALNDISTQKQIASHQAQKSLIPASSLKILTTFITYEQLGAGYTYSTKIAHDGRIDSDGTLQGNIYIIGSGDPSLGSERFEGFASTEKLIDTIAQKILSKGITCIDGDVIVDESIFLSFPIAPSWQWNDLGNYYAGGAWGFNINENEYNIFYNTNKKIGEKAIYSYHTPVIPGLELQHEITVDSANSGDNSYIFGGPYEYLKRVVGTLPFDTKPFKIRGSIPDPPKFGAYSIYSSLDRKGVSASGYGVNIVPQSITYQLFDSLLSPALGLQIEQANHKSINQYCDAFLRTLALEKRGNSSSEEGIIYIENYLDSLKFDINGLNMKDGSGLSARNYIPAELLCNFVAQYAAKHGIETIQFLLPQAGKEGTVKSVLNGSKLSNYFWMKSGSMDRVISFTGVCQTKSGKWVSFCLIVNNYNVKYKDVKTQIERLFDAIWTYA